jgi:hypothetical protein
MEKKRRVESSMEKGHVEDSVSPGALPNSLQLVKHKQLPAALKMHCLSFLEVGDLADIRCCSKDMSKAVVSFMEQTPSIELMPRDYCFQWLIMRCRSLKHICGDSPLFPPFLPQLIAQNARTLRVCDRWVDCSEMAEAIAQCPLLEDLSVCGISKTCARKLAASLQGRPIESASLCACHAKASAALLSAIGERPAAARRLTLVSGLMWCSQRARCSGCRSREVSTRSPGGSGR